MNRAVILGGTGAIGGATAALLRSAGWAVDVTGRDRAAMPSELAGAGVSFHAVERGDTAAIDRLIGDDTTLVVDLLAYRGADVRALLPALRRVRQSVMISGRAVYVDADGNHINADVAPRWDAPIAEDTPTVAPASDDVDPFTREGYAPGKVAAEQVALDSDADVAVLRVSKVHGRWARQARTLAFARDAANGVQHFAVVRPGATDHLTAAANVASLISALAADTATTRVLNAADPDTPTAADIIRAIGDTVGAAVTVGPGDGRNPWGPVHDIVLDTAAAMRVPGYHPVGDGLCLIADEVRWGVTSGAVSRVPGTP